MRFLFRCKKHDCELQGEPQVRHPDEKADLVWEFDTGAMWCPTFVGVEDAELAQQEACRYNSWYVHVQTEPVWLPE